MAYSSDDRDLILSDFADALGALVAAGLEDLSHDASQALHDRLQAGHVTIGLVVQLQPLAIIAYANPQERQVQPVELFRIETDADAHTRH